MTNIKKKKIINQKVDRKWLRNSICKIECRIQILGRVVREADI